MHAVHESSSWPYNVEVGRSVCGMNSTQNIQFLRMDENDFLRKTLNYLQHDCRLSFKHMSTLLSKFFFFFFFFFNNFNELDEIFTEILKDDLC